MKTAIPTSNTLRANRGMKTISSGSSASGSHMVAIRDPPLYPRRHSGRTHGVPTPRKLPLPHRLFSLVPEPGNWKQETPESSAAELSKGSSGIPKVDIVFNRKLKQHSNYKKKSGTYVSNNTAAQPSVAPKKAWFPCFPLRQNRRAQRLDYSLSTQAVNENTLNFGVQVFDYAELEAATNYFDPSRQIRNNLYDCVYYGVLPDGCQVAVKRHKDRLSPRKRFQDELRIMQKLRHTNLETLYGYSSRFWEECLLVYEYIPNGTGTVADHLHGEQSKSRLLSWSIRLSIAVQTATALVYLHQSDIIHGDVTTENILLDNEFHVKVAELNYYQFIVTRESDVYNFGVVLLELISSLRLVDYEKYSHGIRTAKNKIQNGTLQELVDANLSFEADNNVRRMITLVAGLALECLQEWSIMRPSMEQVLDTLKQIQKEEQPQDAFKMANNGVLSEYKLGDFLGN